MAALELRFAPFKYASTVAGVISGYGAYFNNEDSYGDVIAPGAFKASLADWKLQGRLPPMLLQHGGGIFGGAADDMVPVGKWDSMSEDSKGLKVSGHLFGLETDRGKYLLEALREEALDGLSIGFRTRQAINGTKPGEPARTLTELDLWEVSIVTFPANPKARVTSVKRFSDEERFDIEAQLCVDGLPFGKAERAVDLLERFLTKVRS